jgi:hypothetical protein
MYINYAMRDIKTSKFLENCKYNPLKKGGLNKKRHISMLKVKLYFFSSFFSVEVDQKINFFKRKKIFTLVMN